MRSSRRKKSCNTRGKVREAPFHGDCRPHSDPPQQLAWSLPVGQHRRLVMLTTLPLARPYHEQALPWFGSGHSGHSLALLSGSRDAGDYVWSRKLHLAVYVQDCSQNFERPSPASPHMLIKLSLLLVFSLQLQIWCLLLVGRLPKLGGRIQPPHIDLQALLFMVMIKRKESN